MREKAHEIAADLHFRVAAENENILNKSKDPVEKSGLISFVGQNYFYAGINYIEKKLASKHQHSQSHEDRQKKMLRAKLFSDELLRKYNICVGEFGYRGKVAYRGENGNKFRLLKEFAELAKKESD